MESCNSINDFRNFVEAIRKKPGMFFMRSENLADRLQAFLAGCYWGQDLNNTGRGELVSWLREYERWLSAKIGGPEDPVFWFSQLRCEQHLSDDAIFEFFVSHIDEFITAKTMPKAGE